MRRPEGIRIFLFWIACFLLSKSAKSLSTPTLDFTATTTSKTQAGTQTFLPSSGEENDVASSSSSSKDTSRRHFLGTMAASTVVFLATTENASAQELDHRLQQGQNLPTEALASTAATAPPIDWNAIYQKASKKALGGGKAGASAAVVQVLSLMWLRTSMNRQYRYGGDLLSSLKTLWAEGGIGRLYQGLPFALVQGPLTRFGDTAANVGILALLESIPETQPLPLPIKTAIGSIAAGTWRIVLMPIDASKTAMQGKFFTRVTSSWRCPCLGVCLMRVQTVEGADGLKNLWNLASSEGPGVLYQGAVAQAAATAVGHFPWFLTYNFLNSNLPEISASEDLLLSLARSALLGLCASCVSDVCSNSLRVIKTTKQTARLGSIEGKEGTTSGIDGTKDLSYPDIVKLIIETDGIQGLFGRGLQTRLLTNAIQSSVFSVTWKYFQQTGGV